MNYLIITAGFLIGLLLLVVALSINVHKGEKYNVSFWQAMEIYLKKDVGPLILSLVVLLCILFVFPAMAAPSKLTDPDYDKWVDKFMSNIRLYSIMAGVCSQGIGYFIVGKAGRLLKMLSADNSVPPPYSAPNDSTANKN